ncbi:MAG: GNAT family N-acetyltransferase [Actinomycetota bacterium]|nr:GNAT family N-acetyltransferase [Actinomycetota bacterium]MDQ2957656.1 GNAT family N-acetyltransferase [Actinomycetota bacterium]
MTVIQTRPRVLDASDAVAIRSLVARDPVLNCVLDTRLRVAPELDPQRLGGFVWGLDESPGRPELRAAAFHGGNLIPVGDDLAALEVIANQLARSGRGCSSIVGQADAVAVMWPVLSRCWGQARLTRPDQPLLSTEVPADLAIDPHVRLVRPAELNRFLPAAVAMFTEELEISPTGRDAGRGYRQRVAELIDTGRAYARFDERGRVMFKAEIGALSPATAQVQGVWVRPDLRGRGIGTAAMAAVLRLGLGLAPTVSLYVNDFNVAGRRMYHRLGMHQVNTLRTVLF